MSGNGFQGSPEHQDWIESGGRDEDESHYYNKWNRRMEKELMDRKMKDK